MRLSCGGEEGKETIEKLQAKLDLTKCYTERKFRTVVGSINGRIFPKREVRQGCKEVQIRLQALSDHQTFYFLECFAVPQSATQYFSNEHKCYEVMRTR